VPPFGRFNYESKKRESGAFLIPFKGGTLTAVRKLLKHRTSPVWGGFFVARKGEASGGKCVSTSGIPGNFRYAGPLILTTRNQTRRMPEDQFAD